MKEIEVRRMLCAKDTRHPDFAYLFDVEDRHIPREGCACDNCFYGRDKMAVEILRLRYEVMDLANVPTMGTYDTYRRQKGE